MQPAAWPGARRTWWSSSSRPAPAPRSPDKSRLTWCCVRTHRHDGDGRRRLRSDARKGEQLHVLDVRRGRRRTQGRCSPLHSTVPRPAANPGSLARNSAHLVALVIEARAGGVSPCARIAAPWPQPSCCASDGSALAIHGAGRRQQSGHELRAGMDTPLPVGAAKMLVHRVGRNPNDVRDLLIDQPPGDKPADARLAL
jgi:hypothetical protein